MGLENLKPKIGSVRRVILTGGALKSKGGFAPQMFADILGVPIVGRTGDEEGTAKGAALLAGYMVQVQSGNTSQTLAEYSKDQTTGEEQVWEPNEERAKQYDARYEQFAEGVKAMQG